MKQRLGSDTLLGNPRIIFWMNRLWSNPQGIADIRSLIKMLNKEYGITYRFLAHIK